MSDVKTVITEQIVDGPTDDQEPDPYHVSNTVRALIEQEQTWQGKVLVLQQILQGLSAWAGDATSDLEVDVQEQAGSLQELLMMQTLYHATFTAYRAALALEQFIDLKGK